MSRVGFNPINIPSGVEVTVSGASVTAKGPKGTITREMPSECGIEQKDSVINVTRPTESRLHRQMHGLTRALVNNMVVGVSEGFVKELEIVGVGYKAELKGEELVLALGFSHPVHFPVPEGLTFEVPVPTKIRVLGIEKDKVGQAAANIRRIRPPEPYKGKGVKYVGEIIRRKAGKTAVSSGG